MAARLRKKKKFQLRKQCQNPPIKVVVGSSGYFEEGWLGTDRDSLNILELKDWAFLFRNQLIDNILAEHVWEHLTQEDGLAAAKLCYRFLRKGGRLRIAVPDGYFPDQAYIENVKVGGIGPGAEDHKVLYTINTLSQLLIEAGFTISPLEYFDSNGVFHNKEWDPKEGFIHRSAKYDQRNTSQSLAYTSLIIDGIK